MPELHFNAEEVPEDRPEPLPVGDYLMQVIDSELRDTKNGTGQMLVLTLEVVDGPFATRKVWDRLNIRNQNPDAQRIAERSLADLCLAVGVPRMGSSEDLHFKPFTARVNIREDKSGQYDPQNTVRYKTRGGSQPAARPQAKPAAAPAKPWQRTG